jgi:hypothetical protein
MQGEEEVGQKRDRSPTATYSPQASPPAPTTPPPPQNLFGAAVAGGGAATPSSHSYAYATGSDSPKTRELNRKIDELAYQESMLAIQKSQGDKMANEITESLENLRRLAQEIQGIGSGGAVVPDMAAIEEIIQREEAGMRTRMQMIREDRQAFLQHISAFINSSFAVIGKVGANTLMSLIILSILSSDNAATKDIIMSVFGDSSIGRVFTFLSSYIVGPFVDINLRSIEVLAAGDSSSRLTQAKSLLAMAFTGASAYGLTHVANYSNFGQLSSFIQNEFPVLQGCVFGAAASAATAAGSCLSSMYSSVVDYIRAKILPVSDSGESSSITSTASAFSTASQSDMGSVVASILGSVDGSQGGSVDSIAPSLRAAFTELAEGSPAGSPARDTQASLASTMTPGGTQNQTQTQTQTQSQTQTSGSTPGSGMGGGRRRRQTRRLKRRTTRGGRRIRRKTNRRRARRTRR